MGRWIVLRVFLLVLIGIGFEYGINHTSVNASSKSDYSIVQKPTDPPKDKPVQVVVSDGGKFCYGPTFSGGESYIVIEQCWQMHVMSARYDVFQRISYNINNTWLCITAPEKVVRGEENWDYVHLRPCTINDPLQRWIVKENSFWTADGRYRLKDTNWYGYISRNSEDNYNHTLDSSMNDWVKTVATPGNISIKTSIAWDLSSSWRNERYFVRWGGSDKNTTPLYYNPESGHLAQYNPISGSLYCMYSQVDSYNWNWVKWASCSDAPIKRDNPAFWNVFFETNKEGTITDYKGNVLRVTTSGPNWGVVYAVKPSYLEKDTTNNPTSLFVVDKDLLDWTRYTASNLGKTDQYCPAGNKESLGRKRVKRDLTLPSDFQLTREWIQRLYDIARSSIAGTTPIRGVCGVCMLHSYQMIAELLEYHSWGPLTRGGYFFDTAPNRNPFISFGQRYPQLNILLTNVPSQSTRHGFGSTLVMLPQYEWMSSYTITTRSGRLLHARSLINSPPGSIWLGLLRGRDADGSTWGHAVPILRTSQGLVIIPTNSPTMSLNTYIQNLAPTTDPNEVINRLENRSTLTELITIQPVRLYDVPFSRTVSSRDCTGDGEGRRGSGRYPTSSLINQCSEGRCILQ